MNRGARSVGATRGVRGLQLDQSGIVLACPWGGDFWSLEYVGAVTDGHRQTITKGPFPNGVETTV